jgi:hypothetical protein
VPAGARARGRVDRPAPDGVRHPAPDAGGRSLRD